MYNSTSQYQQKYKRTAKSYQDQIKSLIGLPTIPTIASEVLKITREDRISLNQMVIIIEKDPTLSMKLLKVANSAYYGTQERVDSLRRAIVIIGLRKLSSLVTGISIIKAFSKNDDVGINWSRFWEHCAATGHISEVISGKLGIFLPTTPYTSGLLHDIGKLILYRIDPNLFFDSLHLAKQENYPAYVAEMEIFGITHMDAGKWMAEKWQLPDQIINAIAYHHNVEKTPSFENIGTNALIQFSDYITNIMGLFFGTHFISNEIEGWAELQIQYTDLADVDLEEIILDLKDQFVHIVDIVKIME